MLFSEILNSEYTLVSVLSKRNNAEFLHMRNSGGKDIALRILPAKTDVCVYEKLCGISHINLTEIYDVIKENDKIYIVEEYLNATSLSEFNNMSEKGCVRVIIQICQGLLVLHSMGIIHRDIKEDNVLVEDNGNVKLTDFGISKIYKADKQRDTTLLGTPTYAPPEQFGLSQTGFSSDIYSLGILANILVTGKHPSVEMYEKGRLGKFIKRATNINVQKRFSSAKQVIDYLG